MKEETRTIYKPKHSLRMRRFIKASAMFARYCEMETRAIKGRKKWGRKVRYYSKIFSTPSSGLFQNGN